MTTATATRPRASATNGSSPRHIGIGEVRWVPLGKLRLGDGPYQRVIRPNRIAYLKANYKESRLGVFEVVERTDGDFDVQAGQHRVTFLREMGFTDDDLVMCHVKPPEDVRETAGDAVAMDVDTLKWNAYDKYNGRLVAEDPVDMAIKAMCENLKIKILPSGGHQTSVRTGWQAAFAVGTLRGLYKRPGGPELLGRTLAVLKAAWPTEPNVYETAMLNGMALFLAVHGHTIDDDKLTASIAEASPDEIVNDGRHMKHHYQWSLAAYVARSIEGAYNLNRRSHKVRDTTPREYSQGLRTYERAARAAERRSAATA